MIFVTNLVREALGRPAEPLQFPCATRLEIGELKAEGMIFVAKLIGLQGHILAERPGLGAFAIEELPQLAFLSAQALPGQLQQFIRLYVLLAGFQGQVR